MTKKDWQEIRELREEYIGTNKGIALGNLIAEKQRLDKISQIVSKIQSHEDCYRASNQIKEIIS